MKWKDENERILAILALQQHPNLKFDHQGIVDNWPDEVKPTLRAVRDRLTILKRMTLKPGSSSTTSVTTAETGNVINQVEGKNSESFQKRIAKGKGTAKKRHKKDNKADEEGLGHMSDETSADESDANGEAAAETPTRRQSMPRRSKTPARYVQEEDTDEDDCEDDYDYVEDAADVIEDLMDTEFNLEEHRKKERGEGKIKKA